MQKKFLEENYQTFLKNYNERLIESENYVTKRQSIKLLSEVLLDKINFNVMSAYVADVDNLKVIMKLLGDRSAAITDLLNRKISQFDEMQFFRPFLINLYA